MKIRIIKIAAALLGALMLILTFASCSSSSVDDILGAVTYSETYHIVYEVKDEDGVITVVSKSKDENGNIRFCSGEEEIVFIRDGNSYIEYVKGEDGAYESVSGTKVDEGYVTEATKEFSEYAERSREKFMPTVKERGNDEIAGRGCTVYEVKVGIDSFKVSYLYYVDDATGICLGFDARMVLAGINVESEETVFTCVEFASEDIELITV